MRCPTRRSNTSRPSARPEPTAREQEPEWEPEWEVAEGGAERCAACEEGRRGDVRAGLIESGAGLRNGAGGEAGGRTHGSRVASRTGSACWWLTGRERRAANKSSLKRSAATRLIGEPTASSNMPPKHGPANTALWTHFVGKKRIREASPAAPSSSSLRSTTRRLTTCRSAPPPRPRSSTTQARPRASSRSALHRWSIG